MLKTHTIEHKKNTKLKTMHSVSGCNIKHMNNTINNTDLRYLHFQIIKTRGVFFLVHYNYVALVCTSSSYNVLSGIVDLKANMDKILCLSSYFSLCSQLLFTANKTLNTQIHYRIGKYHIYKQ